MSAATTRSNGPVSSLSVDLLQQFNEKVNEVWSLLGVNVPESVQHLFVKELEGLEAALTAVERELQSHTEMIDRELQSTHQVVRMLDASSAQKKHLDEIQANLPARLPSRSRTTHTVLQPVAVDANTVPEVDTAQAAAPGEAAKKKKQRAPCPRWYISQSELAAVPAYMKGRLTQDKVNAAMDEAIAFAEANQRLMVAVRGGAGKSRLAEAERKRGIELYHALAGKENVKGRYWFEGADLAQGVLLKPDKTGQAILTIFRHLGRIQEVRVSTDSLKTVVYVMQLQP